MIEEQMNEMAEAFLRWPLPDDVCADAVACQVGAPNRTGTNLLTAHQALAMIRFVCRPELTTMYADVKRLSDELAALRAHDRDGERYRWLRYARDGGFWSCHEKDGYGGQVLMSGPDLDAAIDAAMRGEK